MDKRLLCKLCLIVLTLREMSSPTRLSEGSHEKHRSIMGARGSGAPVRAIVFQANVRSLTHWSGFRDDMDIDFLAFG
jgi:hypothetical protein